MAYCTMLLLARQVLKTLELDEEYEGNVEANDDANMSDTPLDARGPMEPTTLGFCYVFCI
ncbi:unnamed protein product [Lupinus luteus]|uniref:Uncharacterized protein n=1 Tax=Lupinus luteus TaxID=3873 RepID=A0AAV1XPA8_LUPLU